MSSLLTINFLGLFLFIAGFVIGLGAVTVIDIHGFLGRRSSYWTIATTRAHKVTKPLIWLGTSLATIGGIIFYRNEPLLGIPFIHLILLIVLVINGCFLSFWVSPRLIEREKEGKDNELLPSSWQKKITISFVISFISWWTALALLVVQLSS